MRSRSYISVVIRSYNRADILRGAIESLVCQSVDCSRFEIIVADNLSRDHTSIVIREFQETVPNLRYCVEDQLGSSIAGNRGWQQAAGDYIAFMDHDAKASEQCLERAFAIIETKKPVIFGGPYFAFYNSEEPVRPRS
ncbi:MAG: glycosyltransferase family 2 protein [Desulfomonilaceae bacterium]